MKHVDEYRDPAMARALSEALAADTLAKFNSIENGTTIWLSGGWPE